MVPRRLQGRMAGPPIDRVPLHVTILPMLGIVAWLAVGKAGLGFLALVLATVLLGNVIAAVHHAEIVALRVGEPNTGAGPRGNSHRGGADHLDHAKRRAQPDPAARFRACRGYARVAWARRRMHRRRRLPRAGIRVPSGRRQSFPGGADPDGDAGDGAAELPRFCSRTLLFAAPTHLC